MKLSEYVGQICAGLEATPTDKDGNQCNVTLTLSPEHMEYRAIISSVLRNAFCGSGAFASDALFNRAQQIGLWHEQYKRTHEKSLLELEKIQSRKPIKPKRTIQKPPKRGNIPKAKIERAVKEVKDAAKER